MKITVIGLGKLGLPLAAVLAHKGHEVTGIDHDSALIQRLYNNEYDYVEPALNEMLRSSPVDFFFSPSACFGTDVIIVLVGTPSLPDGTFDMSQVVGACKEGIGCYLQSRADGNFLPLVIISSTVMPGSCNGIITEALEHYGAKRGTDFHLAFWPEFVALGNAVHGFNQPEHIIFGTDTSRAYSRMLDFLVDTYGVNEPLYHELSITDAELAKLMLNFAVSSKIVLANYIAQFCSQYTDTNPHAILAAIGQDSRIGTSYFRAGTPLGGPCFPRDVALVDALKEDDALAYTINMTDNAHKLDLLDKIVFGGIPDRVGIIGYYFKAGSLCDIGMGKEVADYCDEYNIEFRIFDPAPGITPDLLCKCDTLFFTRPGKDMQTYIPAISTEHRVIDPWGIIPAHISKSFPHYWTFGRDPSVLQSTTSEFSQYKGKRCLVTGGTGMIGHQVCKILHQVEAKVYSVSLEDPQEPIPDIVYIKADLREKRTALSVTHDMDYVFHVAGMKANPSVTDKNPASFFTPLLEMNTSVLDAARLNHVQHLVYVSTVGVYPPGQSHYIESDYEVSWPMDRYPGIAKLAGEIQVLAYNKQYGLNWSTVRPTNVYGPLDNFNPETAMLIPTMIAQAVDKGTIELWGDGTAIRDFLHCEDAARGILLAGLNGMGKYNFVNLGGIKGIPISELASIFEYWLGYQVRFKGGHSPANPVRILDRSLAYDLWGWTPRIDIETGTEQTLTWYQKYGQSANRYDPFKEDTCGV